MQKNTVLALGGTPRVPSVTLSGTCSGRGRAAAAVGLAQGAEAEVGGEVSRGLPCFTSFPRSLGCQALVTAQQGGGLLPFGSYFGLYLLELQSAFYSPEQIMTTMMDLLSC